MFRAAGEVVELARIGREIEQLRWMAFGKVNQFPVPHAQHVESAGTPAVVVFAQHRAFRLGRVDEILQRPAAPALPQRDGPAGYRPLYRGADIAQRHRRRVDAGIDAGSPEQQRNAGGILVHVALTPDAVIADHVAVVAGVDHLRVSRLAARVECREHPADIVVEETA